MEGGASLDGDWGTRGVMFTGRVVGGTRMTFVAGIRPDFGGM